MRSFVELLDGATKEIHLIEIPPDILVNFIPNLESARKRGVVVKIIITERDVIPKQLEEFRKFKLRFTTFQKNRFLLDGQEFKVGRFFIDSSDFGSLMFNDQGKISLFCMSAPGCASCVRSGNNQFWDVCTEAPGIIPVTGTRSRQLIRAILKPGRSLSKKEISNLAGLSGTRVKEAIGQMASEGVVKITLERTKGRPRDSISLA